MSVHADFKRNAGGQQPFPGSVFRTAYEREIRPGLLSRVRRRCECLVASCGKPGRSSCKDVPLSLDLSQLATQLHQLLAFLGIEGCSVGWLAGWRCGGSTSPPAWRTQLRMLVVWQPNSLDSSLGLRPLLTRSTICWRNPGAYGGLVGGISDSLFQLESVREIGSTSTSV